MSLPLFCGLFGGFKWTWGFWSVLYCQVGPHRRTGIFWRRCKQHSSLSQLKPSISGVLGELRDLMSFNASGKFLDSWKLKSCNSTSVARDYPLHNKIHPWVPSTDEAYKPEAGSCNLERYMINKGTAAILGPNQQNHWKDGIPSTADSIFTCLLSTDQGTIMSQPLVLDPIQGPPEHSRKDSVTNLQNFILSFLVLENLKFRLVFFAFSLGSLNSLSKTTWRTKRSSAGPRSAWPWRSRKWRRSEKNCKFFAWLLSKHFWTSDSLLFVIANKLYWSW